jgi:hypothetical protein
MGSTDKSNTSVPEAVQWLGYSYLYVRMKREPRNYGIEFAELRVVLTRNAAHILGLEIFGLVVEDDHLTLL